MQESELMPGHRYIQSHVRTFLLVVASCLNNVYSKAVHDVSVAEETWVCYEGLTQAAFQQKLKEEQPAVAQRIWLT